MNSPIVPGQELPAIIHVDAIHNYFELTYAEYLTIPRSVLQSMPDEWQRKFVELLEVLDETIDWRPGIGRYWVHLRNNDGRIVADPLRDYQRGRRRIKYKEKSKADGD